MNSEDDEDRDRFLQEADGAFDEGEWANPADNPALAMRLKEDEYRGLVSTISYMSADNKKLEEACEVLLARIDRLRRERPIEKLAEAWAMLGHEDRHAITSVMLEGLEQRRQPDSLAVLGDALHKLRKAQDREMGSLDFGATFPAQSEVKTALLAVLERRDYKLRMSPALLDGDQDEVGSI